MLFRSIDACVRLLPGVLGAAASIEHESFETGMLEHPQTKALGLLQPVPGSSIPMVGLPVRFDGVRPQPRGASPQLGEMNKDER